MDHRTDPGIFRARCLQDFNADAAVREKHHGDFDAYLAWRAAVAEWNADAALREDYVHDFDRFAALRRAEAAGRIRMAAPTASFRARRGA